MDLHGLSRWRLLRSFMKIRLAQLMRTALESCNSSWHERYSRACCKLNIQANMMLSQDNSCKHRTDSAASWTASCVVQVRSVDIVLCVTNHTQEQQLGDSTCKHTLAKSFLKHTHRPQAPIAAHQASNLPVARIGYR